MHLTTTTVPCPPPVLACDCVVDGVLSLPNRNTDGGFMYHSLDSIGNPAQSASWEDFQEQVFGLAKHFTWAAFRWGP
ncbi:hypothetical protein E2C01_060398 [Portunus trituberculatus]|uniref:Uncharacterized protein n=1 Tax=Portunus trituberculatus TaxID=210409 RepID=A0A5B7H118_PORTR|nr:hypothetical protein [Portunus trituberculatus]